jgi:protein tyrosine phosphatase (PTP) superfamily phosphohydrolase (DUF442 family)
MQKKHRRFSIIRALLTGCVCLVGSIGTFALYLVLTHNFHVVSPGQVYRSGQVTREMLIEKAREHGIKSVLNLRGVSSDTKWYEAETQAARELGLKHYDFPLSARREVTDQEIDQLLAMIDSAPKPLLIHCKSGSDRTGLASALYLYARENKSPEEASGQLTIRCGHFPYLFWRDTGRMETSFRRYLKNHTQPRSVAVSIQ